MKQWLFTILLMLTCATHLSADTIYLKDGTREKSSKIWEKDGYVHFILNGTRNVEIRYAKEIVDHIEPDPNHDDNRSTGNELPKGSPSAVSTDVHLASMPGSNDADGISPSASRHEANSGKPDSPPLSLKSADGAKPARNSKSDSDLALELAQLAADANHLGGVSFYDPKRSHKYWVTSKAQYDSVQQAIDAFSNLYHKPSDWIVKNMGDANDLGIIHRNLIAGLQTKPAISSAPVSAPAEIAKGLPEQSNQRQGATNAHSQLTFTRIEDLAGPHIEGPVFYDPRKPLKYWISESSGYKTFKEAIEALAQMYHRSPEWIEAHMGRTNNLNDIHRNLKQNSEK